MADDCSWYDVTCQLGNLTEQTASTVTDAIVSTWAKAVLEGLDSVLTTLGTFWVKVPTPDVSDSGSVTAWAQGATHWLVIVLAALSTLTACIYLMWHQRGEEVRNIVRGLLTLIIVSAVSITMGQAVIDVADKSATWFLDQATGDPSSNFATKLLTISTIDPGGTTLIVAIVMGLIGLLANLVQMGMMFVRSAMVILLLSAIPLAAATTMTEWGQQWLRKMVGWFIAFAAMKPVAALIYGIAIKLVEGDSYDITDDGELLKFVLGTIMMVLAAFTLPALCAFIVPAVGAVGGGGSGAGALMAGAGGLATGAMSVSRLTGADGADGSGGPPGGGGASGGPPVAAVGTGPVVRESEDDNHARLPHVAQRQDALPPVDHQGDRILIRRDDGTGERDVGAIDLDRHLEIVPHRAAEMTRGGQTALGTGCGHLQGVPARDRIGIVHGGRHGAGDIR